MIRIRNLKVICALLALAASPVFAETRGAELMNPNEEQIFADIPATGAAFRMGSRSRETHRKIDEKRHLVILNDDFQMQLTEVTQLQFFLVMGNNPSYFKEKKYCKEEHFVINGTDLCPHHPIESVSWNEVQDFISKLNQGNDDGYTYRLPTEAEWEYAARAGTTTTFNLGSNISPKQVNYNGNYPYKNAAKGIYRGQTASVTSLPNANSLGLYDMHGNVSEWVQNIYGDYPTGDDLYVSDPQGPSLGSYRVTRGGSWGDPARALRSASRHKLKPDGRSRRVGFRLVRTANSQFFCKIFAIGCSTTF